MAKKKKESVQWKVSDIPTLNTPLTESAELRGKHHVKGKEDSAAMP